MGSGVKLIRKALETQGTPLRIRGIMNIIKTSLRVTSERQVKR
jgi:hypothetical protein